MSNNKLKNIKEKEDNIMSKEQKDKLLQDAYHLDDILATLKITDELTMTDEEKTKYIRDLATKGSKIVIGMITVLSEKTDEAVG